MLRFHWKSPLAAILLLSIAPAGWSETTALNFFEKPLEFPSSQAFWGQYQTWTVFDHVLNQGDSPDFAHSLDTGTRFAVYESPTMTVSGLVREVFQFKVHPDSSLLFNPRALVSDLRLDVGFPLGEGSAVVEYRHDCKHEVDTLVLRDAVHDALGLSYYPFPREGAVVCRLGGEFNLPKIYQTITDEPDLGALSAEVSAEIPSGEGPRFYGELKSSLIFRKAGTAVAVSSFWNVDARATCGVILPGKNGGLRVYLRIDRTTDPWVDHRAEPSLTWTLGLGPVLEGG